MKKDVGKKIMEKAKYVERSILVFSLVMGLIRVSEGVIMLYGLYDWRVLYSALISMGIGLLYILLGRWLAEILTNVTYGFGVLVDKAENEKSEPLEACEPCDGDAFEKESV